MAVLCLEIEYVVRTKALLLRSLVCLRNGGKSSDKRCMTLMGFERRPTQLIQIGQFPISNPTLIAVFLHWSSSLASIALFKISRLGLQPSLIRTSSQDV